MTYRQPIFITGNVSAIANLSKSRGDEVLILKCKVGDLNSYFFHKQNFTVHREHRVVFISEMLKSHDPYAGFHRFVSLISHKFVMLTNVFINLTNMFIILTNQD
jgi:hypothetical protein